MTNSEKLKEVLLSYAPTDEDKRDVETLHALAHRDQMSEDDLCVMWAGALLDGLRYGNWPWVLRGLLRLDR